MLSHHLSCTQVHGAAGAHPSCHGVRAGLLDKWMIKRLNLFNTFKENKFLTQLRLCGVKCILQNYAMSGNDFERFIFPAFLCQPNGDQSKFLLV